MKSCCFLLLFCCAPIAIAHAQSASAARPQTDRSAQTERKRVCLSASEAREAVASHRLIEPLKAVNSARTQARATPLRSELCRWNEEFVYEVTLLKRSGKVVHVFMNAADGKAMNPKG